MTKHVIRLWCLRRRNSDPKSAYSCPLPSQNPTWCNSQKNKVQAISMPKITSCSSRSWVTRKWVTVDCNAPTWCWRIRLSRMMTQSIEAGTVECDSMESNEELLLKGWTSKNFSVSLWTEICCLCIHPPTPPLRRKQGTYLLWPKPCCKDVH